MELPFQEKQVSQKDFIRKFNQDTDSGGFTWHRDREDRLVEVIEGDGWLLQFDNELPKPLLPGKQYIIPEGIYHRVIKGNSILKIKINVI